MSDASSSPSPGWYADPYGTGALRWWDGRSWTEQVAAAPSPYGRSPYAPPQRRQLPADAPVYTVWIWLVAVLPLVSSLPVLLLHPEPMFRTAPGTSHIVMVDPFALIGGSMFFVVIGLIWLLTAAGIVFSWLDFRELSRRGVERPFHWAWSFLGVVYAIGRSIIVRGVAGGRGLAPLWVAIGAYVVAVAISVTWSVMLFAQILGTAVQNVPLGT